MSQMEFFGKKKKVSTKNLVDKALRMLEDKYEGKQQDIFSSPILKKPKAPFDKFVHQTGFKQGERERQAGQENQVKEPKGEAKQLDLFEYQAAQLPKIRITGKLRTKQEIFTTPIDRMDISESGYVIQSPQDAATLLSHLVVEAQEKAYLISLIYRRENL